MNAKNHLLSKQTPFSNTQKDIEVWEKYIHCMIDKYSLRKCAEIYKITLVTTFV